jgi:probable phosphoglycerate mutase
MPHAVWLLRHGDTPWTERGLHTGLEEVELSERGREQARSAGLALNGRRFERVLVSPQSRARETCELAGYGAEAEECRELVEWDYGDYEGLTDEETQRRAPGWNLFCDGAPEGESPAQVAARIRRVFAGLRDSSGPCLLVGHSKTLRALAALWLECEVSLARVLPMHPAAIAVLDHDGEVPGLRLWDYTPSALELGPNGQWTYAAQM